jgi:hypothetical protein
MDKLPEGTTVHFTNPPDPGPPAWKSEHLDKLFTALSKAQAKVKHAATTAENTFFHSKYADLASVTDACRPALAEQGLSFSVLPVETNGETVKLMGLLGHTSGQYLISTLVLKLTKLDAQAVGSAITYGRRYLMAATCGVATEDDDGNAAANRDVRPGKAKAKKDASGPAPPNYQPTSSPSEPPPPPKKQRQARKAASPNLPEGFGKISDKEVTKVAQLIEELFPDGRGSDAALAALKQVAGVMGLESLHSVKDVPAGRAIEFMTTLSMQARGTE